MSMEADAYGPLALLFAAPEAGEPPQDTCTSLSTWSEGLIVLQGPHAQD